MKQKDFSDFKVWCSEIYSLFTVPKGIKPRKSEYSRYDRLMNSDEDKDDDDIEFLRQFEQKIAVLNDPPLSMTTISALIRQYGLLVYNKKTAAKGDPLSFLKKGTDMEQEAVDFLSKIDKQDYKLVTETIENNYLVGRCDIFCPDKDKIIDTKISWNVNAYLKARTAGISPKHWYQMQGYMELYNVNHAEVVFLLLNTPSELIEREKIKIVNQFMIGAIDREKYEIDLENIESAFTYNNVAMKKRYFKYKVKREPQIFEKVYNKVEKAREWFAEFDKGMKSNIFVVPSEKYLATEKNNTEPEPAKSLSIDEG
jgi:hypothetical protein